MIETIATIISISILVFMNKISLSKIKNEGIKNLYYSLISYISILIIISIYILSK